MKLSLVLAGLAACGGSNNATVDAPGGTVDAPGVVDAPTSSGGLGTVTNVTTLPACPANAPAGSTCKQVTVTGCPGLASEPLVATLAIQTPSAAGKGTVVHLSGGSGRGFQLGGGTSYLSAGFRNVYVAWQTDWELTQAASLKQAGCRPATLLTWIFNEPTLQAASRATGFCAEGFSAGSAQLGYSLATYGLGDYLDYVNELSGPPFARIDLGCDGTQAATTTVCNGATVTMKLPPMLMDPWLRLQTPQTCGSTTIPAATVAQWKADSIAVGGVYAYPKTDVEFYDCTNMATAVTGMAQIYEGLITTTTGYHCYTQADGCMGENLGTGATDATNALLAGCTPRHQ